MSRPHGSARRTWVPLFVATSTSDPNSPLITSTVLPPTPRRPEFGSNHSSPSDDRDRDSSDDGMESYSLPPDHMYPTPIPIDIPDSAVSSSVDPRMGSPHLAHLFDPSANLMQRSNSGQGRGYSSATENDSHRGHVRQRSSIASFIMSMPGLGVAIPGSPSVMMERVGSLTSFMEEKTGRRQSGYGERRGSLLYKRQIQQEKKRVWALTMRWTLILVLAFVSVTMGRYLFLATSDAFDDSYQDDFSALTPWLQRVLPNSIANGVLNLETVPYPTSSHPRTPAPGDSITFADYIATRLGSHFAIPAARIPSHLWISPATNASVRLSTPHLRGFVDSLDRKSITYLGDRAIRVSEGKKVEDIEEKDARRKLVTLCLDEGCMAFCRDDKEAYCFGGYQVAARLGGKKLERARESVKLMAALDVMASGRRVFVIDGDVYFRDDPVPFMGALDDFDLQIPNSWTTHNTKAGFLFLNPTASVITLWRRLLELSQGGEDDAESRFWSNVNLLLDPTGSHPQINTAPPKQKNSTMGDANVFDESTHETGYGQAEFVSPWAGGMDVKVLSKSRFRATSAMLDGHAFSRTRDGRAAFFQCSACEDEIETNYIAGALGYHQSAVTYPARSKESPVPKLPMMITSPSLNGTASELSYIMGLLLQVSQDTHRSFVPPLEGHIVTPQHHNRTSIILDRYIWRMFPVARWAHGGSHDLRSTGGGSKKLEIDVLEPLYIQHAHEHLDNIKQTDQVLETLYIDLSLQKSYKEFLHAVVRPFYSTARVITVENVASVIGKKGWELRAQFAGLEMCWEDSKGEATGSGKHCLRRPESARRL
ncbi:hypothetical protein MNV49_005657 [Pseudohyphozyma bogoriensis]|nr:hypothetical protein MNV49_005657 [Pseudohyphozyma bogoriensis]